MIPNMPKSYEETSASNPTRIATGSLFIVFGKIIFRRLEGMFMALGHAAAVGENTLPNLFGPYFRKWGWCVNTARKSERRTRRGEPNGRHSKVLGRQGSSSGRAAR